MSNDRWWRRYWRSLGFGREVNEELAFHVEMLTKDLIARGVDPALATREATRRFGDRRRVQSQLEQIERRRGTRLRLAIAAEELWFDVRQGFRGLLKRPTFTLAAVTSLGLGIASATVILSIIDAWLLKPLAVERPSELVLIGSRNRALGPMAIPNLALPTVADIRARGDLFQDVAAWQLQNASLRRPGDQSAELGWFQAATPNYFALLGVRPALGRTFGDADGRDRSPVVVLNHEYWSNRLGADRSIVGQQLLLNGVAFTVVGVMPPSFRGTEHIVQTVGFIPTTAEGLFDPNQRDNATRREYGNYQAVGRLRPGTSIGEVRAGLDVLMTQLRGEYPDWFEGYSLAAYPERSARPTISVAELMPIVSAVMVALAVLVLGTAAVNVANLVLARLSTRTEEITVRLALGASRWRVVRQVVTESGLLGLLGFLGAWALATLGVNAIGSLRMALPVPIRIGFETGGRVMVMSVVAAVATGLLAGLGPALLASRANLQSSLRRIGRGMGGGGGGARLRAGLIVAQVGAAALVLVSAGLLAESARRAARIDLGMSPAGLMTTILDLAHSQVDTVGAPIVFDRIRRQVEAIPGVAGVALSTGIPLSGSGWATRDFFLDRDNPAADRRGAVAVLSGTVDPNYFELLGIPIRSGRAFRLEDDTTAGLVAVVNQRAADLFWPGQNPIGQTVRHRLGGPPVEVVGVTPTGRYVLIGEGPRPVVYLPYRQMRATFTAMFVKSGLDPGTLEARIRDAIGRVDPNLAPGAFLTMQSLITDGPNGLLTLRVGAGLAASVGALALLLTVVGLYGVLTFSVTQETREIGVRMALGAEPARIVTRVLLRGGRLVMVGLGIGLILALLGTRAMSGLLVGVGTMDARVYAGVAILLIAITTGAAYLPARRAARLDPVQALRTDG
jgi:predicted permease